MKTKILVIISIFIINFSYSQIIRNEYKTSGEYRFDQKLDSYKFKEETYRESKTTVTIDENEKIIILSRQFIPSNGNPEETYEKYYYVKREFANNEYKYFAVDLQNKKYVEFVVDDESTSIAEDCSAFNYCKKVTTFMK